MTTTLTRRQVLAGLAATAVPLPELPNHGRAWMMGGLPDCPVWIGPRLATFEDLLPGSWLELQFDGERWHIVSQTVYPEDSNETPLV